MRLLGFAGSRRFVGIPVAVMNVCFWHKSDITAVTPHPFQSINAVWHDVPTLGGLCRQDPQGREAGRTELPVEQPTKLELLINLKTTTALSLKMPYSNSLTS
jgi:hypothetical protein